MILALPTNLRARIRVNGDLSDDFSISNAMGQGCPLSLLYRLSLEPMLNRLQSNDSIRGITMKGREYAFAGDVLLFPSEQILLLSLTCWKNLEIFHCLAGVKINFVKSSALNLGLHSAWCNIVKLSFRSASRIKL